MNKKNGNVLKLITKGVQANKLHRGRIESHFIYFLHNLSKLNCEFTKGNKLTMKLYPATKKRTQIGEFPKLQS